MKNQLSPLFISIGLFATSISIGIIGYMWLEDYGWIDAFYMTIITISTVGYTEVNELSSAGKLFTTLFILFNLGIFTYFVSVLTSYLFEGKLRHVFKRFMVDRKINKLTDHVIVCGFGRNGIQACHELISSKFDFVVIEKESYTFEHLAEQKEYHFLLGDATEEATLLRANIEKAAQIIITTPSDADNVFIALSSRKLKPDITIISRATFPESESKLYTAGVDHVILPNKIAGMFMAQIITNPVVMEFLNLLTGRSKTEEKYMLESIPYKDLKQVYKDKTLEDLRVSESTGCTVIGVKDNIRGIIPSPGPETFIGEDDYLIVLGSEESLKIAKSTYVD